MAVDGAALGARVLEPEQPRLTLIALHGGPGVASSYMHGLDRLAQDGYRVVTYDQRGVGESELPGLNFSMGAYLSDLAAVQTAAAEPPTVLFGHSWGGLLAMNYAAAHPDRVDGLVLFGSAPPTRGALTHAARQFGRRLERLQQQGLVPTPLPSDGSYLQAIQPVYFSEPSRSLPQELENLDYSPEVNRRTWAALGDYNFRARLAEIDQPVLFFYGEDDPFGKAMAQASLEALGSERVNVVWLEACGHYWFECPGPFFETLLPFLDDLAPG